MNTTEMTMDQLEAIELDKLAQPEAKRLALAELWKRRNANVAAMHAQADANWAASTPEEKADFDAMFCE